MPLPRLVALAALVALPAPNAFAQPEPDRQPVTLGLALGPTVEGQSHLGGSITVQRRALVVSGRLSALSYDRRVAEGLFGAAQDWAAEAAVLGGAAVPVGGRWQASALAGVALVRTHRYASRGCADAFILCIPYDADRDVSPVLVGLPVEAGLHGRVVGALGLGVRAFGTLNADESYGGVALDVRLHPRRR